MSAASKAARQSPAKSWIVVYVAMVVAVLTNGVAADEQGHFIGGPPAETQLEILPAKSFFKPRYERPQRDDI